MNAGYKYSIKMVFFLQGDMGFQGRPGPPGHPGLGEHGPPVSKQATLCNV